MCVVGCDNVGYVWFSCFSSIPSRGHSPLFASVLRPSTTPSIPPIFRSTDKSFGSWSLAKSFGVKANGSFLERGVLGVSVVVVEDKSWLEVLCPRFGMWLTMEITQASGLSFAIRWGFSGCWEEKDEKINQILVCKESSLAFHVAELKERHCNHAVT